jgi:transposase-like protein
VVLKRLRYRLTLRDLGKMFLQRGIVFSHEAVRDWEAKLTPVLASELRRRRRGKGGARGRHWRVDETHPWCTDRSVVLLRVGWRRGAPSSIQGRPSCLSKPTRTAGIASRSSRTG